MNSGPSSDKILLSAYIALISLTALTGIVLLFIPEKRRVALMVLCSVGFCLVAGAITYDFYSWLYPKPLPLPIPEGTPILQVLIINFWNMRSLGWDLNRSFASFFISAIGLFIGWCPLWFWFRFRGSR